MRSARLLPLSLVVLVGVVPSARASDGGNSVSLGVFGGGHLFAEGSSLGVAGGEQNPNGAKDSVLGGLRASVGVGRWFVVEAELAGLATQDRVYQQRARLLGYRVNALAPLRSGDFRPFVLVGAGALQVASSDGQGSVGLVRDAKAEVHTGIGFFYRLGAGVSLRADARVLQVPSKVSWGVTTDVEATLGASVSFGGWASSRKAERPPEVAVSAAALDPPEPTGLQKPRTVPEEPKGLPAIAKDAPAQAVEVSVSLRARPVSDLIGRAREIKFEPGTTKLTSGALAFLEELAAALVDQPEACLEIVVHVADSGNAKKDLFFSWRRAQAVKYLLIGRGASVDQLTADGHGGQEPIAPNLTRTGRARNERVDLHRGRAPLIHP